MINSVILFQFYIQIYSHTYYKEINLNNIELNTQRRFLKDHLGLNS